MEQHDACARGDRPRLEGDGGDRAGAIVEHFDIYSHTGRLLASVPLERTRARIGAECVGINRAELLPALAEELPEGVLALGKRCVGVEETDGGVVARFADGSEEHGDVLVGADGAHSTVRRRFLGDDPPRYAGYTIWQGITNVREEIAPIGFFPILFGPGQRFAYYHVNEVRLYWFAVANAPEGGSEPPDERKVMLLNLFRGWPAQVAEIIASTPVEATHRRDLYDREPDQRWGEGRVTLLGDAAHAMTFDLGQGAGQSIEDAVVLARCLSNGAGPTEALRAYERRRMDRTAHMQKLSRFVGRTAMWEHPLAVRVREAAWRAVLGNRLVSRKLDNDESSRLARRSRTATSSPRPCAASAAASPATPPPTTSTRITQPPPLTRGHPPRRSYPQPAVTRSPAVTRPASGYVVPTVRNSTTRRLERQPDARPWEACP